MPNSSVLKDVDLTDTATQSEEIGNILNDINSYATENELVKKFRYKGTSRRPYESDDSIKNLESLGWDIEPKEPPQEKFTQIEQEEIPEITRQDLFEKNEINLLFKDKKGNVSVGGADIELEGELLHHLSSQKHCGKNLK